MNTGTAITEQSTRHLFLDFVCNAIASDYTIGWENDSPIMGRRGLERSYSDVKRLSQAHRQRGLNIRFRHSHLSGAEVDSAWNSTSTPPYVFMVCSLTIQRRQLRLFQLSLGICTKTCAVIILTLYINLA
jgi:hypothetical protein